MPARSWPSAQPRGCQSVNLGDAFIAYLEDAAGRESGAKPSDTEAPPEPTRSAVARASVSSRCDLRRPWAYARRETIEILRDPIRLAFSFLDPLILMLTVGYGISFDFEHLAYAAFDQDQTTRAANSSKTSQGRVISVNITTSPATPRANSASRAGS
jgi:ribosome-dependent ATPase